MGLELAESRGYTLGRATLFRLRQLWSLGLVVSLLALGGVASAADDEDDDDGAEARSVVQSASDRMLVLLEEAKGYYAEDPERFYSVLAQELDGLVDFAGLSKSIMGRKHWPQATEAQRQAFAVALKAGLVRTFGTALVEFDNEKIEVLEPGTARKESKKKTRRGHATVRMKVTTGDGKEYPMEYSMRLVDGGWQVRNVVVQGLNLGLTYQNQFNTSMSASGADMDQVIADWSKPLADDSVAAG